MTASVASDVGRRIALLRHRLGLSQTAFARQAGISRNSLIVYERGERVPKSVYLVRIAEAGKTSVDWLLNGRVSHALKPDPEWDATVLSLRVAWRDPVRRRLAVVVLTALGWK
jgi:transcriptional regulator with XRE-family HTH domain